MPVTRKKPDPNALYVCVESFGSSVPELPACSRGAKLRGDNPYVKPWPGYFVPADSSDDEVRRARQKIYADAGASPPA
jgi:hypothetical protein